MTFRVLVRRGDEPAAAGAREATIQIPNSRRTRVQDTAAVTVLRCICLSLQACLLADASLHACRKAPECCTAQCMQGQGAASALTIDESCLICSSTGQARSHCTAHACTSLTLQDIWVAKLTWPGCMLQHVQASCSDFVGQLCIGNDPCAQRLPPTLLLAGTLLKAWCCKRFVFVLRLGLLAKPELA